MPELSIKLDYLPSRERPAEVFEAMALYIEAYKDFGQVLINSVGIRSDFEFQLNTIEKGSILSKLSALPNRFDSVLEGVFYTAASKTLGKLTKETSTEAEVESLSVELEEDIVSSMPNQTASPLINRAQLSFALKKFSMANEKMKSGETISFASDAEETNVYQLDTGWRFTGNPAEMFLGQVEHFEEVEGKFYVLTVVNEGNAVWSFRNAEMDRRMTARITHKDWLDRYQNGLIQPIGPKDLLQAVASYDVYTPPKGKGSPSIRNARITHIKSVIRNKIGYQYELSSD